MSLTGNKLNESLPDEIQQLTNLEELSIGKNKLSGRLKVPIADGLGEGNKRFLL